MTSNLLSDGGYEASSMWTGHGTRQVAQHEPEVAGPVTDGRPMNQSYWLALLNHDAYAASFQSVGQYRSALIERASSPRAQPEREGPTDEEWCVLKMRLWEQYETVGYQGERFMYDADFYTALDVVRQEITRYAHPTIEPVPDTKAHELLSLLLDDLDALVDSSEGVAGLHLNGDVASWESLREGGRFETWLMRMDEARAFLDSTMDKPDDIATTIEPVPVAERPWEREGWCDAEGFCWDGSGWTYDDANEVEGYATWTLVPANEIRGDVSLPHHALPVPGA